MKPAECLRCSVMLPLPLKQAWALKTSKKMDFVCASEVSWTTGFVLIFHSQMKLWTLCSLRSAGANLAAATRHSAKAGWGVFWPTQSSRIWPIMVAKSACVCLISVRRKVVWSLNDEREEEGGRVGGRQYLWVFGLKWLLHLKFHLLLF